MKRRKQIQVVLAVLVFLFGINAFAQVQLKTQEDLMTAVMGVNNSSHGIVPDGYYDFETNAVSSAEEGVMSASSVTEEFECWQGIPSVDDFPMSWRITLGQDFRLAEDFTVPEETTFLVKQLTFDTNNVEVPDFAVIYIHEDDGEQPGAILHTIEMEPSSWEEIGVTWDEPIYKVIFDLEEPIEFSEGMYWVDPHMSTPSGLDVWWGGTNLHEDGLTPRTSSDNGATWTEFISLHMAFTVSGHCETLSTADLSGFDFSYYPNPVRDVLHINSAKKVENVRVFNLTGQEINFNSKTGNGQINVNALPTGVYVFRVMLEGGRVETFKIIKN